jgi:hypothetical protein
MELVAATEEDNQALRGLGTYGLIRGATGFILGAVRDGDHDLEDFGYVMEQAILFATSLELGTCWLGGTFTRSSFADKMALTDGERMPTVTSTGYISEKPGLVDRLIRRGAGSRSRLPWERLFFENQFDAPLSRQAASTYGDALEMVRLGPSASNRQPWRIVKDKGNWHFYLRRTPGYHQGTSRWGSGADLQRVDMGIAMCHFEATVEEIGLAGQWVLEEPDIEKPDEHTTYTVSWVGSA